jgi:hypothetical protein
MTIAAPNQREYESQGKTRLEGMGFSAQSFTA